MSSFKLETVKENITKLVTDKKTLKVFGIIGALYATKLTLEGLCFFYKTFLRGQHNLVERYGRGSWVLITSPTSLLGRAFASEFGRLGFNLCLVGENAERLTELEQSLKKESPAIQVKLIEQKFENSLEEGFFDALFEQLKGLDVSVLINNAIFSSALDVVKSRPQLLLSQSISTLVPTTILTQRLLTHMLAREKRSAIINISSIATVKPKLYSSAFTANMIFDDYLVRALNHFYGYKIDLLSARSDEVEPHSDPIETVRSTLRSLGRETIAYSNWKHQQ